MWFDMLQYFLDLVELQVLDPEQSGFSSPSTILVWSAE